MTYYDLNRILSAFASLALLAGCSPADSDRIVGSWKISDVGLVSGQVTSGAPEVADSTMAIEFGGTGSLRTSTRIGKIDSVKEGTWKFLAYEPEANLMQIQCTLQLQTTEHTIEFENEQTIKWIPPNMAGTKRKIRFVRVSN